jgi:nucleotide-binding universal stress UspA family protein
LPIRLEFCLEEIQLRRSPNSQRMTVSISSLCRLTPAAFGRHCSATTARVINNAPCPVLTSRHAETIAPRPLKHRQIFALDLTPYADTILGTGKAISEQARAELSLIHVVNVGKRGRLASSDIEECSCLDEVRRAADMLEALTHRHGVTASTQIAVGSPKDTILQIFDHSDVDVLIIGRSSTRGSPGRLTDLNVCNRSGFPLSGSERIGQQYLMPSRREDEQGTPLLRLRRGVHYEVTSSVQSIPDMISNHSVPASASGSCLASRRLSVHTSVGTVAQG